jgi:hypothetical protein
VLTEGIEGITGDTRLNTRFDAFLQEWLSARKAGWTSSSLERARTVLERLTGRLSELARGAPAGHQPRAEVTAFRNAELERISP